MTWAGRREGLRLGGLITLAIGIGFMVGFQWVGEGVWMLGALPAAIGVGLLAYALILPASRRS